MQTSQPSRKAKKKSTMSSSLLMKIFMDFLLSLRAPKCFDGGEGYGKESSKLFGEEWKFLLFPFLRVANIPQLSLASLLCMTEEGEPEIQNI